MLVESLAYQYTRKPPKNIKPRHNVLIRLCTIECSYIQPLDGEQNQKFAEDMEGWSKLAKHPVRGKYRLLASLRCEETLKEGKLGSWGVYDAQGKKSLKSMVLQPKDFATADGSFDRKFRWIDLGVIDFVPGAYFWFAHGHNPQLDAIFVDRVVLIRAE